MEVTLNVCLQNIITISSMLQIITYRPVATHGHLASYSNIGKLQSFGSFGPFTLILCVLSGGVSAVEMVSCKLAVSRLGLRG